MAMYIEYELEDGTTVLIESSEPETVVVRASTKVRCSQRPISQSKRRLGPLIS